MERDIQLAKAAGATGVVLGVLTCGGTVDLPVTRRLVEIARPMQVTFHRAFDVTRDLDAALEDVIAAGADIVLTSGGAERITEGIDVVTRLVERAGSSRRNYGRLGRSRSECCRAMRGHRGRSPPCISSSASAAGRHNDGPSAAGCLANLRAPRRRCTCPGCRAREVCGHSFNQKPVRIALRFAANSLGPRLTF